MMAVMSIIEDLAARETREDDAGAARERREAPPCSVDRTNLPISFIVRGRFKVAVSSEDGHTVRLEGVLDEGDNAVWFSLVLDEIHRNVIACGLDHLTLDICNLEVATCALWKGLAGWLSKLGGDDRPYAIRLLASPERPWQEAGAQALLAIGGDRFLVDERAPNSGSRPCDPPVDERERGCRGTDPGPESVPGSSSHSHFTRASRFGTLR
jgi:hypothetical protein